MPFQIQVLIEAPEDLNFLVFVESVTTSLSGTSNSNPSPSSRQLTSSTSINDDRIRISGWIRDLCGGGADITDIVSRLKRTIESQKYTTTDFATITTAHEVMTNMKLESVDVDRSGKDPQETSVSMTWEANNFSGSISSPNFSIGGVQ